MLAGGVLWSAPSESMRHERPHSWRAALLRHICNQQTKWRYTGRYTHSTRTPAALLYCAAIRSDVAWLKWWVRVVILHSQYHNCWCPGDLHRQSISSIGFFFLFLSEYSPLGTGRPLRAMRQHCVNMETGTIFQVYWRRLLACNECGGCETIITSIDGLISVG